MTSEATPSGAAPAPPAIFGMVNLTEIALLIDQCKANRTRAIAEANALFGKIEALQAILDLHMKPPGAGSLPEEGGGEAGAAETEGEDDAVHRDD